MTELPIIFSGPMVNAILAGRKTQTRRVIKPQPADDIAPATFPNPDVLGWRSSLRHKYGSTTAHFCRFGKPGDRLWVREALREHDSVWQYEADEKEVALRHDDPRVPEMIAWAHHKETSYCSPIHAPRWASRITLAITGVRVERVQAISEADAVAEGFEAQKFPGPWWQGYDNVEGRLMHRQFCGDAPPEWMLEPKRMEDTPHLDRSARDLFRMAWYSVNAKRAPWDSNPWVWVIEFNREPTHHAAL